MNTRSTETVWSQKELPAAAAGPDNTIRICASHAQALNGRPYVFTVSASRRYRTESGLVCERTTIKIGGPSEGVYERSPCARYSAAALASLFCNGLMTHQDTIMALKARIEAELGEALVTVNR